MKLGHVFRCEKKIERVRVNEITNYKLGNYKLNFNEILSL